MLMLDLSLVTYNSERWIEPFIQSLLRQALPCAQISLLWRDNGSGDATVSLLQRLREQLGHHFHRFEIEQGSNVGFGRGHNANLNRAEAEFFLVSNVDLEFEADTLVRLLESAQGDPQDVAVWECRQKPFEHPKDYNPVTGDTLWCSSACAMFRTEALRAVDGYEPQLFMYGEDVELSYRLRDRGYRLRYIPQATVWHYTYEQAAQLKPLQFLGSTLANVLLRCRYGSWREIATGFAMYLGLFLVRQQFPHQRARLFANLLRLVRLSPYFLLTRRRSRAEFPFRLWDYAMIREGAFYRYRVPEQSPGTLPLVSVLVRTMPGRSGKLKEAVASVAAQTYGPIELVIVEDGGSTAQALVEGLRTDGRFASVVYLPMQKLGRCGAGNAAMAGATGQLMCFLDDDDLFYADHLEVLVSEWLSDPALGAVYSLAYEVRTEVISDEPWVYRDVEHSLIYRQSFSRGLLWHHNYLPIQTVLFQRRLYQEMGGFDHELDNLEDWNLWVRYSLHHDFRMVNKVTSLYRVPAVSTQAAQRQQVLDDYYDKAQAKHAKLRVELSPPEVLQIAQDLARELYLIAVPVRVLRNRVLGLPFIGRLYHPIKSGWTLLQRIRRR